MDQCPACGNNSLKRYKAPVDVSGLLFRRHRCESCQKVTTSVQIMLTTEAMMEEALELSIRRGRTSDPMQSAGDGLNPATLELMDSLTT